MNINSLTILYYYYSTPLIRIIAYTPKMKNFHHKIIKVYKPLNTQLYCVRINSKNHRLSWNYNFFCALSFWFSLPCFNTIVSLLKSSLINFYQFDFHRIKNSIYSSRYIPYILPPLKKANKFIIFSIWNKKK